METWIGIDIGTTNCKVGVCNGQYELLELYTMATPRKQTAEGDVYDPEVLGQKLLEGAGIMFLKECFYLLQVHKPCSWDEV